MILHVTCRHIVERKKRSLLGLRRAFGTPPSRWHALLIPKYSRNEADQKTMLSSVAINAIHFRLKLRQCA
jgi:hypothetical protein